MLYNVIALHLEEDGRTSEVVAVLLRGLEVSFTALVATDGTELPFVHASRDSALIELGSYQEVEGLHSSYSW